MLVSGFKGCCLALFLSNVNFASSTGFDSCFLIHLAGFILFVSCIYTYTFVAMIGSSFTIICFLSRFEKMLNEMLSHLERQPRNKEQRILWLKFIEPIFNTIDLVLLAHLGVFSHFSSSGCM